MNQGWPKPKTGSKLNERVSSVLCQNKREAEMRVCIRHGRDAFEGETR